jgi:hypothetical protein
MTIEFAMLAGTLLFFSKLHRFHCVADFHRIGGLFFGALLRGLVFIAPTGEICVESW